MTSYVSEQFPPRISFQPLLLPELISFGLIGSCCSLTSCPRRGSVVAGWHPDQFNQSLQAHCCVFANSKIFDCHSVRLVIAHFTIIFLSLFNSLAQPSFNFTSLYFFLYNIRISKFAPNYDLCRLKSKTLHLSCIRTKKTCFYLSVFSHHFCSKKSKWARLKSHVLFCRGSGGSKAPTNKLDIPRYCSSDSISSRCFPAEEAWYALGADCWDMQTSGSYTAV